MNISDSCDTSFKLLSLPRQVGVRTDILIEDLTIACLCHDICDCRYDRKVTGHGRRSRAIVEKSGIEIGSEALKAIECHSHEALREGAPRSSRDSGNLAELLHYDITSVRAPVLRRGKKASKLLHF